MTGKMPLGKPFAKQTWAKEIGADAGPVHLPNSEPTPEGNYIWPGVQGATDWYSPSYNPLTKFFYLAVWENQSVYRKGEQEYAAEIAISAACR